MKTYDQLTPEQQTMQDIINKIRKLLAAPLKRYRTVKNNSSIGRWQ